jgi:NADH-ubiquinone oxidoreductase chain 5
MYLSLLIIPIIGSIISGFLGRKIGVTGSHLITCLSIFITTLIAITIFIEVGLNNSPVILYLFR